MKRVLLVTGAVFLVGVGASTLGNNTPIVLMDEGVKQRSGLTTIDCRGAGISCGADGGVAYVSVSGGGSGATYDGGKVGEAFSADASYWADRFIADPTDCGGGQFANAIDRQGNLTCATPGGGGKVAEAFAADASITSQTATTAQNAFAADASYWADRFIANPTDCEGGQYATAIDQQGNLTCSTPPAGGATDAGVFRFYVLTDGGNLVQNNDGGVNTRVFEIAVTGTYSYEVYCNFWSTNDGGTAQGTRYRLAGPTGRSMFTSAEVCAGATAAKQIVELNAYGNIATNASAGTARCRDQIYVNLLDAGAGSLSLSVFPETAAGVGGFAGVWAPSYCDVTVRYNTP